METHTRSTEAQIASIVITDMEAIEETLSSSHGLSGWFKGYIQSRDFTELDNEAKAEAFSNYELLKNMLEMISNAVSK